MLEVVEKLILDKELSNKEELPTVICNLLRPYSTRNKISKEFDAKINQIIKAQGICSRCRSKRLKYMSDTFCKFCKSVIKEQFKN